MTSDERGDEEFRAGIADTTRETIAMGLDKGWSPREIRDHVLGMSQDELARAGLPGYSMDPKITREEWMGLMRSVLDETLGVEAQADESPGPYETYMGGIEATIEHLEEATKLQDEALAGLAEGPGVSEDDLHDRRAQARTFAMLAVVCSVQKKTLLDIADLKIAVGKLRRAVERGAGRTP